MKIIKAVLLASTIAVAANAMANEVVIHNRSNHPIPVMYQFAYHNLGHPVILKRHSQTILYGHTQSRIHVPLKGYDHAGIIVLAVKRNIGSTHWHYLPTSLRQFDGTQGCWVSTNPKKQLGHIGLKYYASSKTQGRITCS